MKVFHDVHTHNFLSDCCEDGAATAEAYIAEAARCSLKVLGFANHIWDERAVGVDSWYRKQSLCYSMQIKKQIPTDTLGVKVLVGCETEYCGMSDTLGMTAKGASMLDYVLIPHSHMHMKNFVIPETPSVKQARQYLKEAFMDIEGISEKRAINFASRFPEWELDPYMTAPKTNDAEFAADFMVMSFERLMNNKELAKINQIKPISIAHPFQAGGFEMLGPLDYISDETFERLISMAVERGIGLEINTFCGDERVQRIYKIAKSLGCKFTLGSDSHSIDAISTVLDIQPVIDALGLTEYDFMDFVRV